MSTGVVSPLIPKQRFVTLACAGSPGVPSPGVATIEHAGRKIKIDKQEGYGTDGGRLIVTGTAIQDISVSIRIWEPEHWVLWKLFYQVLTLPTILAAIPGITAPALSIDHPILKELGISSVLLEDPGFWVPGETGDWTRKIDFVLKQKPIQRLAATKEGPPATAPTVVPLTATQRAIAAQDAENAPLR